MKTILVIITVLLVTSPAFAVQKYNPFNNKWETTSSDSELEYNPHENTWSYEQKGSTLEYNSFENKWEYAPPSPKGGQGQGAYGPSYDPYGYDRKGW
jgi:hypothetical protein